MIVERQRPVIWVEKVYALGYVPSRMRLLRFRQKCASR
jgi:hypothetical protein